MKRYRWSNVRRDVRQQVHGLVGELRRILGSNLVGAYLYGSLATGHFRPETSDLDFLIVIKRRMTPATKRRVADTLLRDSNQPIEIELSILARTDIHPWRHPSSFDFHYSEQHRRRYQRELQSGIWRRWRGRQGTDPDLAADITLARYKSIPLVGEPAKAVLPVVPGEDFLDASRRDVEWARERLHQRPVYAALNPCRILAYFKELRHLSREEAGVWALGVVPDRYHAVITAALNVSRGRKHPSEIPRAALRDFTDYVEACIGEPVPARTVSKSRTRRKP